MRKLFSIISIIAMLGVITLFVFPNAFATGSNGYELIPTDNKIEYINNDKEAGFLFVQTPLGNFDPMKHEEPFIPEELIAKPASGQNSLYLLQYGLSNPQEVRNLLKTLNIDNGGSYGDGVFLVKNTQSQIESLKNNPLIRSIVDYHPGYKIEEELKDENGRIINEYKGLKEVIVNISILNYDNKTKSDVEFLLNNLEAKNIYIPSGKATVGRATIALSNIEALSKDANIVRIELNMEKPKTEMNGVHKIINVDHMWSKGYTGLYERVAVVDTGIDEDQPALKSRVYTPKTYGASDATTDTNGHGTHVTGIIAGNGTNSTDSNKRGVGYNTGTILNQPYLGQGASTDIGTVMQDSWDEGFRINNNSWGKSDCDQIHPDSGAYTTYEETIDNFIYNHTDYESKTGFYKRTFLFVKSSGNNGYLTTPAAAKNIITVGGTYNSRDGYTYGDINEIFNEPSGSNCNLDWISGKGPTDDGRIKPDIVAPGWEVAATRSLHSTDSKYYNSDFYTSKGGTSMSAAVVTGASTLVWDYFKENYNIKPSASFVKAVLINGAYDLPSYYLPSDEQGWGRLNIQNSIAPNSNWGYSDGRTIGHKETKTFTVDINYSEPFVTTLTWVDPAGKAGSTDPNVNDLDLYVYDANGNKVGSSVRANDTVEQVRIDSPNPGTYSIKIHGYNVPGEQPPFSIITRHQ